jgi:hypothetical protein
MRGGVIPMCLILPLRADTYRRVVTNSSPLGDARLAAFQVTPPGTANRKVEAGFSASNGATGKSFSHWTESQNHVHGLGFAGA